MKSSICIAAVFFTLSPAFAASLDSLAEMKDYSAERASSADPNWHNGNGDARALAPGETRVLAELEGPGVIRHIWNTIAPGELGYPRLVVLRMYWDGESEPSVECPLGDFFAVGHGLDASYSSAVVSVASEGRARNCYWPMPFRKSARITISNEGRTAALGFFWHIDWERVPEVGEDEGYFHAQYRQAFPAPPGNYTIADIRGKGHYVGTVLSVRQHTPGWWGEGDDFFFIDGEEAPRLRGTGTEDYFCDAWGFRLFSHPYYGVTVLDSVNAGGRTTCYRWHVPDPVRFQKQLRVEIEHKGSGFLPDGTHSGFVERSDDMSSVAFWYQAEPHAPFPPLPAAYDRVLHDPDALVETEALEEQITVSHGTFTEQVGPWSGSRQVLWVSHEPGHTLTVPLEVEEAGDYNLLLIMTKSYDYGIFQAFLDDRPLGAPIDFYHTSFYSTEFRRSLGKLEAGTHTLRFENKGKRPESLAYLLGLDCWLLEKK